MEWSYRALVKSRDLETLFSFKWAWSQGLIPSRKGKQGYPPSFFVICLYFFLIWLCKNVVKWVGSGRGRLRPVQNDRTGGPDVLGVVLAQNSWKKGGKKQKIRNLRGGLRGLRGRRRRGAAAATAAGDANKRLAPKTLSWGLENGLGFTSDCPG